MSDLNPDIDLGRLARPGQAVPRPPRFKKIWLLPIVVLLVFLLLLWSTLGDLLSESRAVTILRPRAAEGGARAAGSVLLQAAGWVEPDPFPVAVTALTGGVVAAVLVQESDPVSVGQVLARLVPDLKQVDRDLAEASLGSARERVALATVEFGNAQESFDAALGVTEGLAVAEAELAAHEDECARNEAAVAVVSARLEVARRELETQRYLAAEQAAGPWQLELAEAKLAEVEAERDRAREEHRRGLDLKAAVAARVTRAKRDLELRLEDRLRLDAARANLALQRSLLAEAEARLALAALHLDWCEVKAPVAGIVLERLAMPGSVASAERGGTPLLSLYDPEHLRIRVDVPQADLGVLEDGQEALILSNARPDRPYHGRVIRIVQRADIQKVTVEVQVRVLDGDALLKPEMLCQVRFLGGGDRPVASATAVLLVPQRLIVGADGIWVVDAVAARARFRRLRLGARVGDEVEVLEGLNLSDKLIDGGREGLEEGAALRLPEEER
ncbi:MAG: HlyD family efflux transporter periplasmic adaptor subunit [Planctomycetes bacterium]|nr:HlyD family efflux transporter periplasmic adaptor subunit [Planctomycetota bacterium]